MGNYKKYISFFDKALRIEPENIHVLQSKGFAFEKLGDVENSKCFDEVERISSQ